MLLVFTILAVLGILVGAAFLATYEGEILRDPHPDDRDATLPPGAVQPEDIGELRFDLALRGYRMAEVDGVLHRLRDELAARDTRIAELERALVEPPAPVASAPLDLPPAEPERTQAVAETPAVAELPVPPAPPVASAPEDTPPAEPERTQEPPDLLTSAPEDTPPAEPERTQEPEHRFSLDAADDAFSFPELTPPPPAEQPSGEEPSSP